MMDEETLLLIAVGRSNGSGLHSCAFPVARSPGSGASKFTPAPALASLVGPCAREHLQGEPQRASRTAATCRRRGRRGPLLTRCGAQILLQMAKDKRQEVCTREYTINLGKRLHGITFKKKAPRAVKEIKKFAQKQMKTKDVRVDVKLNKAVWSQVRRGGLALLFPNSLALKLAVFGRQKESKPRPVQAECRATAERCCSYATRCWGMLIRTGCMLMLCRASRTCPTSCAL